MRPFSPLFLLLVIFAVTPLWADVKLHSLCLLSLTLPHGTHAEIPGLILDLNADRDVTLEDGTCVSIWQNQVTSFPGKNFEKRDQGRKEPGSGRPTLIKEVKELNGHNALDFRKQELVCQDPKAFSRLSTGETGCTWFAVLSVHPQYGLKDVHSFFGNLRNGASFDGLWGGVNDDNTVWWGIRNGITVPKVRFDENNKQVFGPKLEPERFYLVAGRMPAGTGMIKLDLYVNGPTPVGSQEILVRAEALPNRLAIGQERDATNHPGVESFTGEIARFMIFQRPLTDAEIQAQIIDLQTTYKLKQ